jgi:hypothetical protein
VAKVGAGAVKAGEFITKLPKVSDVVLNTIKKFPGFKLPHIELPHTDIPTTHIDSPQIELPGGHAPTGPSVGDGLGQQHPLPPAATITHDGVVDGRPFHEPAPHTPAPSIVHDGVIGGHPRVDTPAPHADAPVHNAEPLPPGATITDKGIVPGGHGSGPLADAGSGLHVDHDGVLRAGNDAPVPHGADPAGSAAHGGGTPAAPTPHGADAPGTPHGADATPTPHGGDAPTTPHGSDAAPTPHGGDAGATPAPHGAGSPATHGTEAPGADAPVRDAEPLPPGATITDRGVVPGTHGTGPLADAGAGLHIDRDGVLRPGTHADAPAPREPALVGAGERPLVQDGVIGGHGGHLDDVAGGGTHVPTHDPLIRDGVIGGGRGIDHAPPLHGEPSRPGGVHPPEPPRGGRLPEDPAVHPHEPGGGGHDPADHPPHEPTPHEPGAHDQGTPHDGSGHDAAGHDAAGHDAAGHDGGTHDGGTHDGAGHDPGSAPPHELTPQELADVESRRSDVVNHNQQEFDQLSVDSDHGGRITNNSREEAGTLLDMRETGALPDDVRRPTDVNSGDAVSGSGPHEVHYDIKHERDSWPPQARKPPGEPFPPRAGGYSTAGFEHKLTEQIVQKQRVVIIDTRGLKQVTIDDMHNLVATHGWENNVIWYP